LSRELEEHERAWDRHALEQERARALIACTLVITLMPAWSVFDFWLEPDHAPWFLVIRLAVSLVGAGAYVVNHRAARSRVARIAMLVAALATGIAIAYFIARIDAHYVVYVVGFSLVFWSFGPLLAWPWAYTAGTYVVILAVHVGFRLAGRGAAADTATFYGLFAYLASAAIVSTMVSLVRRRLEYQAFVASYKLSRRNAELATALATLRDAQERFVATEKLSALGRLIAQLSHEINNPVNVLQNNLGPVAEYVASFDEVLELAAKRDGDATGPLMTRWKELDLDFVRGDIKEAIATMVAAAERIRTIQQDLRSFLRGDSQTPTEADFNAGVRSTVTMLRRNLPARVELVEQYGELPPAQFHTGQVNQVTLNLLQNAIDAVGGEGRIEVATRLDGGELVLSVTDTGPGVSEDARTHMFEPFFTTKDIGKGTGLGLATCYQIIRAHGGTIVLDEGYDTGARFVVRLPAAR
jgi:signal transduction histidine kinase